MRVFFFMLLLLDACALAFGAGTRRAPAPKKFLDIENSPSREEQKTMDMRPPGAPTFGLSVVIGGKGFDSGGLPPPPIPIVAPL